MEKQNARVPWLDGLKGLACLGVFTHHFMLAFFRASYFGGEAPSMTASGLDTRLSYEPYGVLINGNFWVCVFLVISSFLLAAKVMRAALAEEQAGDTDASREGNDGGSGAVPAKEPQTSRFREVVSTILLRRYPRLMLPALAVGIGNYLLLFLLNRFRLNYIGVRTELSPLGLLLHSLVIQWITPDTLVLGPFWMLHTLLFSSFLAVLLAIPGGKKKGFFPFLYLLLLYPFGSIDRYYTGAVWGVFLADVVVFERVKDWAFALGLSRLLEKGFLPLRRTAGFLTVLAGLYLGGYPSYVTEPVNFYRHFGFYVHRVQSAYQILHCLGAFLLLLGIFLWRDAFASGEGRESKSPLLENRCSLLLGRLSFAVYLLHILWIEYLGYYLVDSLKGALGYVPATALVYVLLLVLILLSAEGFHRSVERVCDALCARIRG
mgnify:CR=1 FL=1